jgi:hypothetical protein
MWFWLISLWKLICWFLNLIGKMGKSQIASSCVSLLSSIDSGIKWAVTCRRSWIIISADLTSEMEQNRWHGSGWLDYNKDMNPANGRLLLRRLCLGAEVKWQETVQIDHPAEWSKINQVNYHKQKTTMSPLEIH